MAFSWNRTLTRRNLAIGLSFLLIASAAAQDTPVDSDRLKEAEQLNQKVLELYAQNKYDKAIPLARRAATIFTKELGSSHPDVATMLSNLAELYMKTGKHDAAKKLYLQAVKIRLKAFGPNHELVGEAWHKLAKIYLEKGNYGIADSLLERTLAIMEKLPNSGSLDTKQVLHDFAVFYQNKKEYDRAISFYHRLLRLPRGLKDMYYVYLRELYALIELWTSHQEKLVKTAWQYELDASPSTEAQMRIDERYERKLKLISQEREAKRLAIFEELEGITAAASKSVEVVYVDVRRHPSMSCPDEVISNEYFPLVINLTEALVTPNVSVTYGKTTAQGELVLSLPDQDSWTIDVVISAPAFEFKGWRDTGQIVLPRSGDSSPAVFYLRAKNVVGASQRFKIYGFLSHEGRALASFFREVNVLNATVNPHAVSHASAKMTSATLNYSNAYNSNFQTPDLTVTVLEGNDLNQPEVSEIIINSPYLQIAKTKFIRSYRRADWLDAEYSVLARGVRIIEDSTKSLKGKSRMLDFGKRLYDEFAPSMFKRSFWQLLDKLKPEKFQSIQIYTNAPEFPWELMRPSRDDGSDTRDFLGVEFRVARWHVKEAERLLESPPQGLPITTLAVVAPRYSGNLALPSQQNELMTLQSFKGYTAIAAKIAALERLFQNSPSGIIHFSGHGQVKPLAQGLNDYAILLEDGDLDLPTWHRLIPHQLWNHPFVFFNACDVGKSDQVANFVDGWAPAVLEAGASGYVGGLWALGDRAASEFAICFYQELQNTLRDRSAYPADILKNARRVFYEKGDPTYLAYVFYGDPNFRFTRE